MEDNDINRDVARELMHSVSLDVQCAENGRIAVEPLREQIDAFDYAAALMSVTALREELSAHSEDQQVYRK